MREILFRGKRVDNGEWVEGYYSKWQGEHVIFPVDPMGRMRKAHPETVAQFTGLFDKNSKRIFEGDILESYLGNTRMSGVIKWENDSCGWTQFRPLSTFEIIGNIHDNPKLI